MRSIREVKEVGISREEAGELMSNEWIQDHYFWLWSESCQIMMLESENVKQAFEEQDIWVQCNLQYRQYHKKNCVFISCTDS